jgi:ubiquitin thioesterase OTU1
VAAKKLASILREKKAFTNTSTFDLKCEVCTYIRIHIPCSLCLFQMNHKTRLLIYFLSQDCGQGLKGEKGARAHASQTGHVRFGEY